MGFRVPTRLRAMRRRSDRPAERPEGGSAHPAAGGQPEPAEPAPARPAESAAPKAVVPRWIQLVVLPLAILGLWALARASGPILLVLVAASTIALIVNPLVTRLHRR